MSQDQSCKICKTAGVLDPKRVIFEDDLWRVRHSDETNIAGYLILESRRHFLDLSEASDRECSTYGELLRTVTGAIRKATDCSRVYTFSLAEMVPHFHLHLIPRTEYLPQAYRARGIMSYPLSPAADPSVVVFVCERIRRAMKISAST
jgi:histidine triad (HIT) family protein